MFWLFNMWLLKINSLGDTLWTRHFGGGGHTHCYSASQTPEGDYIAAGHTDSYSPNTEILTLGQEIFSSKMTFPGKSQAFDLKGMEAGIYFLNVRSAKLVSTQRIVLASTSQ